MAENNPAEIPRTTLPRYAREAAELALQLATLTTEELERMLRTNRLIAVLPGHDDQTMFGYWQGRLTEAFLEKIHADDGILVNLASSEMKRLFDWKRIRREARIITPEFRIREGDRLKTIVVYTKMCRGEMTRHLIRNRIADPEMLKEFEWEGFRFDAALSRGDDWTFTM